MNNLLHITHKINTKTYSVESCEWKPSKFKKISLIFNQQISDIDNFDEKDLLYPILAKLNKKIQDIYSEYLKSLTSEEINNPSSTVFNKVYDRIKQLITEEIINSYYLQQIEHENNLLDYQEESNIFYNIFIIYQKSIYIEDLLSQDFINNVNNASQNINQLEKKYTKVQIKQITELLKWILKQEYDSLLIKNNYIISVLNFLKTRAEDTYINIHEYHKYIAEFVSPIVDNIMTKYWSKMFFNLQLLTHEIKHKKEEAFNKLKGPLNYYFDYSNKKISPFLYHCKVDKLRDISLVYENITEKYYEKRANSSFIPAGSYSKVNNLIQMNVSKFHTTRIRYLNKHGLKNIMFHEFGHAVEAYWEEFNFKKFLPHSKKCYKILNKIKVKYARQEYYSQFEYFDYYCKPEVYFTSDKYKIYNYKRSVSESFAESFGLIMLLYTISTPDLIKGFNRKHLYNMFTTIKMLSPTMLYILENLKLEEVGFCKHNHQMKILFIRKLIHSIYNKKMTVLSGKSYYDFNNKDNPESSSFIKNIRKTKLKKIKV